MNEHIAILGAGSWGTAFATLLANNGHDVLLWCHEKQVAQSIDTTHENTMYLPGVKLAKCINATTSIEQALTGARYVFEVIPVKFLRSVLEQAKPYYREDQIWVLLSKGIEQESLMLPSALVDDVFATTVKKATVSGPNFAKDLVEKIPTATTVAADDCETGEELMNLLANPYFRPYLALDIVGVQLGGAIKNVLALAVGIAKGAGHRDNTIAFLLTRGLSEMGQLARYFGGRQETIYGLSGLGDLVLTAFGAHGRNLRVGTLIGQGKSLEKIEEETGIIAEGVNTVQSLYKMLEQAGLSLPICKGTYEIVFNDRTIDSVIEELMAQPLCEECV